MGRGHRRAKKTVRERKKVDKAAFVKKLREVGSIEGAVAEFWRGRATIYRWREEDPEFVQECDEAIRACYGKLRTSMMKRAMNGSDTLAIFLAKGRWPEEFREQLELKIKNDPGVRVLLNAVVQIFKEFIPKEKLRDAVVRFSSLTGYQGPTERHPASIPGPDGQFPDSENRNGYGGAGTTG